MENCLFCNIIAGKIPSDKVYEDDEFLAFRDIYPAAPVHLLIVPKRHISTLSDYDGQTELLGKMLALVPQLAQQHGCEVTVDSAGQPHGGYKTLINSGPDGGQEVYHLHIHLLGGPRPWTGRKIPF